MPGQIVLYGATGYMGTLTAQAMVASGMRPLLAGRNQARLTALAARLATEDGQQLDTAVAGTPSSLPLQDLVGPGDVLVSTAGPFMKIGRPAVQAAVDAGAIYLDSSAPPPTSPRSRSTAPPGRPSRSAHRSTSPCPGSGRGRPSQPERTTRHR